LRQGALLKLDQGLAPSVAQRNRQSNIRKSWLTVSTKIACSCPQKLRAFGGQQLGWFSPPSPPIARFVAYFAARAAPCGGLERPDKHMIARLVVCSRRLVSCRVRHRSCHSTSHSHHWRVQRLRPSDGARSRPSGHGIFSSMRDTVGCHAGRATPTPNRRTSTFAASSLMSRTTRRLRLMPTR
jgi:hypothetical protein